MSAAHENWLNADARHDNGQVTLNAIVFRVTTHVTVTRTLACTDYPDLRHPR